MHRCENDVERHTGRADGWKSRRWQTEEWWTNKTESGEQRPPSPFHQRWHNNKHSETPFSHPYRQTWIHTQMEKTAKKKKKHSETEIGSFLYKHFSEAEII